jgi:large subunit ribosomal protein L13
MGMTNITIDAKGKVLGRLASQIATTLQGKNRADYRRDRMADITVTIENVNQFAVTGNKMKQKKYYHFSGYPGGLREWKMEEKMATSPAEVLMLAVKRMLPTNRTRAKLMKRLIISAK